MKFLLTILFILSLEMGCQPKVLSGPELENKLKETMKEYLDTTLQPRVKATVNGVIFYPEKEKKRYICQFSVTMHYHDRDTTGTVVATITNDFEKIERKQ